MGQVLCEGGDPNVLAAMPAWAKVPAMVKVDATSVVQTKDAEGIGYSGSYDGPIDVVQTEYSRQLKAFPEMNPRYADGGQIFLARKDGDLAGSYLSLTPQKTTSGADHVEIKVYVQL